MTILVATTTGDNPINTHVDLSDLGMGGGWTATPTVYSLDTYGGPFELVGFGFAYDVARKLGSGAAPTLTDGVVTGLHAPGFALDGFSIPATTMAAWIGAYPDYAFNLAAFSGADSLAGGSGNDILSGDAGNDTVSGGGGSDILDGGTASRPVISGPDPVHDGSNYLRGDDGDDQIYGGAGFDDINGNRGNDTAHGGSGDDWVVGGKDNDLLLGDDGNDIVWGNLGDDTCDGAAGADQVRGGQGDDSLSGGSGDDWLSGDRGNDTIIGGTGADVFHTFVEAGVDRVLDFDRAEGDRVQLDPGTTCAVSQAGADVVIDMSGGGQMVLVGVSISSLTDGWIFEA